MRRLAWGAVTLGTVLLLLPLVPFGSPFRVISAMVCQGLGVVTNSPGLLLVSALVGYPAAKTVMGRLSAWFLTLLLLEPVLRWLEAPSSSSRRNFLVAGGTAVAGTLVAGYGYAIERVDLKLESHLLALPDLPPELEGLRIVLMADWHCGPINRPRDLLRAIELANAQRPDLILIPGDFISVSGRYFAEAAELAAQLRPAIPGGVLIKWGNHDYWHGIEEGLTRMPQAGCQVLTNTSLVVTLGRNLAKTGNGLWIAGTDDLWAGKPDLNAALAGLPPDQPRLVLCHNPDLAELQSGPRVDLMLSGHTHGGQVRLPIAGVPVVPSQYGQKYAAGWVEGPHYPVYITRGVGVGGVPVRLGVPPEVTLFVLGRGPRAALVPA